MILAQSCAKTFLSQRPALVGDCGKGGGGELGLVLCTEGDFLGDAELLVLDGYVDVPEEIGVMPWTVVIEEGNHSPMLNPSNVLSERLKLLTL